MSGFKDSFFIKELAYRTKINYLNVKKNTTTNSQELMLLENQISQIKDDMKKNRYVVEDYYEITLLINSLIGLLVFPEQAVFSSIRAGEEVFKRKMPTLYKYSTSSDRDIYLNTYKKTTSNSVWEQNPDETSDLETLARNNLKHLKNAISHNRIMIWPINGELSDKSNQITDIVFEDAAIYEYNESDNKWKINPNALNKTNTELSQWTPQSHQRLCRFYMKISVCGSLSDHSNNENDLESMLDEISNYLISLPAPNNRKKVVI